MIAIHSYVALNYYICMFTNLCMYVDTLPCDALCHYGNTSEYLMNSSNLWKRTRVYSPCTTNHEFVSDKW